MNTLPGYTESFWPTRTAEQLLCALEQLRCQEPAVGTPLTQQYRVIALQTTTSEYSVGHVLQQLRTLAGSTWYNQTTLLTLTTPPLAPELELYQSTGTSVIQPDEDPGDLAQRLLSTLTY